jgi:tetratricopeptide (TPR) repeat protein
LAEDREPSSLLGEGQSALARGDAAAAEAAFRAVLGQQPRSTQALHGLGKALHDQRRLSEAEAVFRQAEVLGAAPALARYHAGLLRLLQSDSAAGWPGWEERLNVPSFGHPRVDLPRWRGEIVAGRRLLVLAEQGFGDIIQFARFLPWVVRQSRARVTFGVPRALLALLQPFGAAHGFEVVTGRVDPARFDLLAWVLVTGLCLWLIYGFWRGEAPIIAANGATLLLAGTILFFKLRYRDQATVTD